MAYHFPLMPRMYMAIAQEDRHPIVEIIDQTPDIPDNCQWAIFLRNHDELTLEMVTSRERDYMYQMYAADPRARLNLGIRRRLAPLMDNDVDRIKLMNSLLLSMPGSPIIYYGDEIGMGDNFFLGDRNGVRTPDAVEPGPQCRASRARIRSGCTCRRSWIRSTATRPSTSRRRPRDRSSLLNWMRRMLRIRKQSQAFGRGTMRFIRPGQPQGAGVPARVRRGHRFCAWRTSAAFRAAGGDRSGGIQGRGAHRTAGARRPFRRSANCPTC